MKTSRLLFGVLLLAITLTAYFIPYYDWDLVAYVGSTIALNEQDSSVIQQQAYAALRTGLPEEDYADIASGSDFRSDVAKNADHFRQQLRFYQIRPLYIWILAGLHRLAMGYVQATRIVSAAAFFLIGVLVQAWLRRYVGEIEAGTCAILLLLAPVLFTSARTGSPDALSAFVVLLGVYFSIEHDAALVGSALLLLSLSLRTDNLLFVLLFSGVETLRANGQRIRAATALAALSAIAMVLMINHAEHSYRWAVLMQNTATPIVNPADVSPRISISDYFASVHDMVDEARENSVTVFPFIAAIALFSSRTPSQFKRLVKIVLLSWAAHVIIFPHVEDRYFIAGAVMIGLAAVLGLLETTKASLPFAVANE
jgi:hypothetical protein